MADADSSNTPDDDGASNLRAIFEILSYIHVDAQRDNYTELADRIEFSLNLAEKMIRSAKPAPAAGPGAEVGTAVIKNSPPVPGNNQG